MKQFNPQVLMSKAYGTAENPMTKTDAYTFGERYRYAFVAVMGDVNVGASLQGSGYIGLWDTMTLGGYYTNAVHIYILRDVNQGTKVLLSAEKIGLSAVVIYGLSKDIRNDSEIPRLYMIENKTYQEDTYGEIITQDDYDLVIGIIGMGEHDELEAARIDDIYFGRQTKLRFVHSGHDSFTAGGFVYSYQTNVPKGTSLRMRFENKAFSGEGPEYNNHSARIIGFKLLNVNNVKVGNKDTTLYLGNKEIISVYLGEKEV